MSDELQLCMKSFSFYEYIFFCFGAICCWLLGPFMAIIKKPSLLSAKKFWYKALYLYLIALLFSLIFGLLFVVCFFMLSQNNDFVLIYIWTNSAGLSIILWSWHNLLSGFWLAQFVMYEACPDPYHDREGD
jgi:hypothetical protein